MWAIKCDSGRLILEDKDSCLGIVIRIHSNYYYVDYNNEIWECMLRSKLKKEGTEPKVGDKVLIDEFKIVTKDDVISIHSAVITSILTRNNELDKPNVANIDQAIIVTSTYSPDFNPLLLDKFIVLSESNNINPIICINKSDKIDEDLREFIERTYRNIGYEIVYTSAKENQGLDDLKKVLSNKISVLTGVSGSGKSSLINAINPELSLQVAEVSKNLGTGRHTTRHVSLQKVFFNNQKALIADTPGFSFIELNNIQSKELAWNFREFTPFIPECALSDCLHWQEPDCNVKRNINTETSRYNNYLNLLIEVLGFEKINNARSSKKESQVKISQRADGKNIRVVKIGSQARENSRRTVKQELSEIGKRTSIDDMEED